MARSFSIASYNVLADSYVKPQWYPNVDPEVLRWDRRKFALAERVERLDTDIICLQEVEADAFALLEQSLGAKGYEGVYTKKGERQTRWAALCFSGRDGCASWRRYGLLPRRRQSASDSGHLALIISFECEWGVIRVVNTHLRWGQEGKSPEEHIGYRQIRELIDERVQTRSDGVCVDRVRRPERAIRRSGGQGTHRQWLRGRV